MIHTTFSEGVNQLLSGLAVPAPSAANVTRASKPLSKVELSNSPEQPIFWQYPPTTMFGVAAMAMGARTTYAADATFAKRWGALIGPVLRDDWFPSPNTAAAVGHYFAELPNCYLAVASGTSDLNKWLSYVLTSVVLSGFAGVTTAATFAIPAAQFVTALTAFIGTRAKDVYLIGHSIGGAVAGLAYFALKTGVLGRYFTVATIGAPKSTYVTLGSNEQRPEVLGALGEVCNSDDFVPLLPPYWGASRFLVPGGSLPADAADVQSGFGYLGSSQLVLSPDLSYGMKQLKAEISDVVIGLVAAALRGGFASIPAGHSIVTYQQRAWAANRDPLPAGNAFAAGYPQLDADLTAAGL